MNRTLSEWRALRVGDRIHLDPKGGLRALRYGTVIAKHGADAPDLVLVRYDDGLRGQAHVHWLRKLDAVESLASLNGPT